MSRNPSGTPDLSSVAAARELRRLNFQRSSSLVISLNVPLSSDTVYPRARRGQASTLSILPSNALDLVIKELSKQDLFKLALTCTECLILARPALFHRLRLIGHQQDMEILERLYLDDSHPSTSTAIKAPIAPCIRALEVKRPMTVGRDIAFEMMTGILPTLRNLAAFQYEGDRSHFFTAPTAFFAALAVSTTEHLSLTGFRVADDLDLREVLGEHFVWRLKTIRLHLIISDYAWSESRFVWDLVNMSSRTLCCLYLDTKQMINPSEFDGTTLKPLPQLTHIALRKTRTDTPSSLYHPSAAPSLKGLEMSLYDFTFLIDFTMPNLTLVTVTNCGQALVETPSYSFSILIEANPQITHINLIITDEPYFKHLDLATHFILPIRSSSVLQSLSMAGHPDILTHRFLAQLSTITTLSQLRLRIMLPARTEETPSPPPLHLDHVRIRAHLKTLVNLEILVVDGAVVTGPVSGIGPSKKRDELFATALQYAWTLPRLRILVLGRAFFRIATQNDGEPLVVEAIFDWRKVVEEVALLKRDFRSEEHMYER